MSYTKQTWNTGDTITAQKLNHMEDGISGAVPLIPNTLIVTFTFNEESYQFESDTAFQDMYSAAQQGKSILGIVPSLGSVPLQGNFNANTGVCESFIYSQVFAEPDDQTGEYKLIYFGFEVLYDSEAQKTLGYITNGNFYVAQANG